MYVTGLTTTPLPPAWGRHTQHSMKQHVVAFVSLTTAQQLQLLLYLEPLTTVQAHMILELLVMSAMSRIGLATRLVTD